MYVQISRINEANNDLILSEREAWVSVNVAFCLYYYYDILVFIFVSAWKKRKPLTLPYIVTGNFKP